MFLLHFARPLPLLSVGMTTCMTCSHPPALHSFSLTPFLPFPSLDLTLLHPPTQAWDFDSELHSVPQQFSWVLKETLWLPGLGCCKVTEHCRTRSLSPGKPLPAAFTSLALKPACLWAPSPLLAVEETASGRWSLSSPSLHTEQGLLLTWTVNASFPKLIICPF